MGITARRGPAYRKLGNLRAKASLAVASGRSQRKLDVWSKTMQGLTALWVHIILHGDFRVIFLLVRFVWKSDVSKHIIFTALSNAQLSR